MALWSSSDKKVTSQQRLDMTENGENPPHEQNEFAIRHLAVLGKVQRLHLATQLRIING